MLTGAGDRLPGDRDMLTGADASRHRRWVPRRIGAVKWAKGAGQHNHPFADKG
jgi:hypothetical protein